MTYKRDQAITQSVNVEEEDKQEFIGNNTNKEPVVNNTMCWDPIFFLYNLEKSFWNILNLFF